MAFDGNTSTSRDNSYSGNITLGYGYPHNFLQFMVKNPCNVSVYYGSLYMSAKTRLYENTYPNALPATVWSITGNGTPWKWYTMDVILKPDTNYMLVGDGCTVLFQVKFT